MSAARDPSQETEYIKAMIESTQDDARHVHLRVTLALGIAVLYVTQLPFERLALLRSPWSSLLVVGVGLLLAAAGGHLYYLSRVHRSRRDLTSYLRDADGDGAEREWKKVWHRWGWLYEVGDGLLLFGLFTLGVVLVHLLGSPF